MTHLTLGLTFSNYIECKKEPMDVAQIASIYFDVLMTTGGRTLIGRQDRTHSHTDRQTDRQTGGLTEVY